MFSRSLQAYLVLEIGTLVSGLASVTLWPPSIVDLATLLANRKTERGQACSRVSVATEMEWELRFYLQFQVGESGRVAESLGERIRVNLELGNLFVCLYLCLFLQI